ncbi:hypothetical protein KY495_18110 [Massilia sp. PAMC28688]|uniref:hypothetical protein n=1 Tax=Massilia sp. PAMC28688 TaxID=2861283 RepID=UPI001C63A582|nr:hypothetical protein [Massilia sp. PAMC28688]QYF92636.1 hypothetical protein KY495_18110 [Massilia sp. PAMC28688]
MSITLLSPGPVQLQRFALEWPCECTPAGLENDDDLGEPYAHVEVADDLLGDDLAIATSLAINPQLDAAPANGSSIAFIAAVGEWRGLFSADAFPAVLMDSLTRLEERSPHKLNVFKLPHHGSKGNVTEKLLNNVECSHLLFSSNGDRFGHPDRSAIARVIADKRDKTLHFNHRTDQTLYWDCPELKAEYGFSVAYTCDTADKVG